MTPLHFHGLLARPSHHEPNFLSLKFHVSPTLVTSDTTLSVIITMGLNQGGQCGYHLNDITISDLYDVAMQRLHSFKSKFSNTELHDAIPSEL